MNSIWENTKKVLLFIHLKSIDEVVAWREALKSVGLNINECQLVCFIKNKKERAVLKEMSSVTFLAENDFNLFGKITYEDGKKVLADKYDLAIWMGDQPPRFKRPLSKLKSNFKVGINAEGEDFDIKLNTEELNPEQIVKFAKNTLQRIS